jgi:16S rRNA (cytosine967-C5)-methyltransferase
MNGTESRRAAIFAFISWKTTGRFVKDALPDGEGRSFVQDLVYTAIRRMRAIRHCLGPFVGKWPAGEVEAALYIGAAQILFMPGIPDYAAVGETVSAVKSSGRSAAGFVNAVLRSLLRRRDEVMAGLARAGADTRESFPRSIYARWTKRFGEDGALELMRWHNLPAETFLAYPGGRFEKLERAKKVGDVEGYAEGKFIVQDPGTALAVELVAPGPGQKILDLCAAPGGKTVQMAWRGADVTACEISEPRRKTLQNTISRLGVAVPVVSSPDEAEDGAWDKVLVDAPCSNTGVFRRRPEARWSWSPEKMRALVAVQASILDKAAAKVKPGGVIVYSTCSIEPEENSMQAKEFISRHPEFVLEKESENVPHVSRTDGAYAARLVRRRPEEKTQVAAAQT